MTGDIARAVKDAQATHDDAAMPWDELREARVLARVRKVLSDDAEVSGEAASDDVASDDVASDDVASDDVASGEGASGDAGSGTNGDASVTGDNLTELRESLPVRRTRHGWLVAFAVAAAVVLAIGVGRSFDAAGPPLADNTSNETDDVSVVKFADGSRSLLTRGAQVDVVVSTPTAVRVRQPDGRARYEVVPNQDRRFEVEAHGVLVTVVGTVFEVVVAEGHVSVAVERGRVRVRPATTSTGAAPDSTVELGAGERITLEQGRSEAQDSAAPRPAGEDAKPVGDPNHASSAEPQSPTRVVPPASAAAAAPSSSASAETPTAAALMRRADAARAAGRLNEAAAVLRRLISQHPRDQRVTLALFSLGKVERRRGHHRAAATAFEQCGDALRGDALVEAASSWSAAGNGGRAAQLAQRYLTRHPAGVHAESMRALAAKPNPVQ